MEAELILDDEDFPINPRITYHKRLRGRMELCSFLAGVWKRHALLSMDGLQKKTPMAQVTSMINYLLNMGQQCRMLLPKVR